ncbi:alpha/beta-hydrolase [Neolentinus lepideus HHB14362 ss-1]|uniref:Alpha/beta-hydrolase n=1 Tax=Neolentinus lepideus HHB14362 ss-1 TaxID=1314782 RepID=A0A165NBT1_9AGAM|nr:alpha/beta-hydrolase [Neolentinus lepideus HHB14362 ss-1]
MGNTGSRSATISGSQSLGASGKLSASAQSGRASQNFAAVVGIFMRAYENGDINVPEIKKAIEGLSVALDKDPKLSSTVDLSFISGLKDWKQGNQNMFAHVQLAAYCAKEVYNLRTKQDIDLRKARPAATPGSSATLVDAEPVQVIAGEEASYLHNTKNWALFKDPKSGTLYFSVRGTSTTGIAAVIDNLTNLDAGAQLTQDFDTATEKQGHFQAHKGFLDVANSMFSGVKDAVMKASKGAGQKPTLVFCGHSAGGGTAFFLYHYFQIRTTQAERDVFKDIHCITFGSAAIASVPNPVHTSRAQDRILSFINLNDPVPRAEVPYAEWLAESLGRYLAVQSGHANIPPFSPLPKQTLYPGGELVLLDEGGGVAGKLESNALSGHAFLDLSAHDSSEYKRIVYELLK